MPATITEPHHVQPAIQPAGPRWRRLAWFVGLWLMGVAVVGVLAFLFRLLMKAAG